MTTRKLTAGKWSRVICAAIVGVVASCGITRAADHFLAIGGGDSPDYNQISLEKNILFFQRLLIDKGEPESSLDVLFADGSDGTRDVQVDASNKLPKANMLLARLFNQENGVGYQYRTHQVPNLRGPSNRQALNQWFDSNSSKLGEGDRLFIYFTGHGGPGNPQRNTTISLWNERAMQVTSFVGLLDRLSPKVQVVLIMVQCHSGGFADVIFSNARAGSRLSSARRCGFFATTPDRNAAGCTADTAEDDYKDYSTYFFAALDGQTRTKRPVTPPDYDHDGRISLAEAHAYTVLNSETIDIPLTTSDVLLRQFSRLGGEGRLSADSPFDTLLDRASPGQRAILEGLANQLNVMRGGFHMTAVRQLADKIAADRKEADRQRTQRWNEADNLAKGITGRLTRRWPELSNPWNPRVAEMLKLEGAEIAKAIESDRSYSRFQRAYDQFQTATNKDLSLEHQWAKCQRLVYTAESIALAVNLDQIADPLIIQRYRQMLEDEAGMLPQLPTTNGTAAGEK